MKRVSIYTLLVVLASTSINCGGAGNSSSGLSDQADEQTDEEDRGGNRVLKTTSIKASFTESRRYYDTGKVAEDNLVVAEPTTDKPYAGECEISEMDRTYSIHFITPGSSHTITADQYKGPGTYRASSNFIGFLPCDLTVDQGELSGQFTCSCDIDPSSFGCQGSYATTVVGEFQCVGEWEVVAQCQICPS